MGTFWGAAAPECVVPRHEAGEGEDHGVSGDLLLPQGTFNLLPVPRHNLVIVRALFKGTRTGVKRRTWESRVAEEASVVMETLTAAVYNRRAGRQENLLEFWRNNGNRRPVDSRLCQVEKKNLS